ncbi:hypothetical protein ACIQFU_06110 [Streptomyces sp. NPDC093065]|uniref:hypothetical protein n=1 Tax=Streptomyces sp. NPDC093065 TaxID=3366021 RepID=UPI0037FA91C1
MLRASRAEDDSPLRADLAEPVVRARWAGLEPGDVLAPVTAALDEHAGQHGQHEHDPGDRGRKREDENA